MSKILTSPFYTLMMHLKIAERIAYSVNPDQMRHLIWVYPNCSVLSVPILRALIYHMYLDRQAGTNSLDSDETPRNAASHQSLHCLPLIQQFLDTTSGSKLYLFKFRTSIVRSWGVRILRINMVTVVDCMIGGKSGKTQIFSWKNTTSTHIQVKS